MDQNMFTTNSSCGYYTYSYSDQHPPCTNISDYTAHLRSCVAEYVANSQLRIAKFIDRGLLMYQQVMLHCPSSFVAEYTEMPWQLAMNVWIQYTEHLEVLLPTQSHTNSTLYNSATATSLGIESELQYVVNENFAIFANIAYNDFALDSVVRTDAVGGSVDVKDQFVDDWVAASPDFQGTVGLEYFHGLNNLGELRWWTTIAYRDKISANAQSSFQNAGLNLLSPGQVDENFYSDSHTDIGAGVSFTSLEENWRVDLSVSNLLDQRRPEAIVNSIQGLFFGTLETWNRPRTWALTLSYDF